MRRRLLLAAGLCAAAAAVVWAVAFHVAAVQQADIRLWEHVLWRGGPRSAHAASDLLSLFDPARDALLTAALVAGAVLAGRRRQAVLAGSSRPGRA